jgi:hypothetical protein
MKRGLAGPGVLLVAIAWALPQPLSPAKEGGKANAGPPAVKLSLRPAPEPSPALKYVLVPPLRDQQPGNAAFLYHRAHSPEALAGLYRSADYQKMFDWTHLPLRQFPRDKVRRLLPRWTLGEIDRGARRAYCDWELTERIRKEGIAMLVPDVQFFREVATLLALRARLEMAEGKYDQVVDTLQTGYRLAKDLGEAPTVMHALVGVAIGQVLTDQLEDLIQAPGSPNLYWALASLPRPLVDLRKPLGGEGIMAQALFPELGTIETTPLSLQRQQEFLRKVAVIWGEEGGMDPATAIEQQIRIAAVAVGLYPRARRALIAAGRKPKEIDALPPLQVVLIHSVRQYRRLRDDLYKWYFVPFSQAQECLRKADALLHTPAVKEEAMPFSLLLPALGKVRLATVRLDRRLAALRCVEAIRLYAAGHQGKLPASLADIQVVPVPADPVTGKPFRYTLAGGKAALYGPPPLGKQPSPDTIVNYELSLRR